MKPVNSAVQKPGMTLAELAAELRLSSATVSLILNGRAKEYGLSADTVHRVREAAQRCGYVPNRLARGLRRQRTDIIGLVLPHLRNNWAHQIMEGMWPLLEQHHLMPFMTCHLDDPAREQHEIDSLLERQVDGLICVPLHASLERYRVLDAQRIPLVFLSDTLAELPGVPFTAWHPDAVGTAVGHLLKSGRRRIAYVGGGDRRCMAAARRRAYTDTLRKAGRRIRRNHIIERGTRADFSAELDRLMGTDPAPDAVFCVYDELAMTVVDYLHAHGHAVPEEIAVATLADSSLAEKGYGLTTVAGNIPAEGARAMQIMLHRLGLRKGRRPGPWIRKRTLIARATT